MQVNAPFGKVLNESIVPFWAEIEMKTGEFYRVKQAAELLGVVPNTVRAWGASGKLPEYRHPVNNYRLYKKKDLMALLRKLEKPVTPIKRKQ